MTFADFKGTPFEAFVVPIIPVGAKLSPHSKLTVDDLGRVPGFKYEEGWGGFGKAVPWTKAVTTSKLLDTYAMYKKDGLPEVYGLLGKKFPALDIDCDDKRLTAIASPIALRVLGPAPMRTRPNNEGRLLLPYRYEFHASTLLKMRRMWRTPSGYEFSIEFLADGQIWTYGTRHWSGVPYEWTFGVDPLALGYDKLSTVTTNQVLQFFNEVTAAFEEDGCVVVKGSGNLRMSGFDPTPRTVVGPDHVDLCPDLDMLKDLLTNYLPVTRPEFMTYYAWAAACVAIVTACGKNEEFYPVFEEWGLGEPRNDDSMMRAKWESVRESSIGWSYLCNIGREYSYFDDLQFEALGEPEDHQSTASSEETHRRGSLRGPIPKLLPADFDVRKLPRRQFVLGRRFIAGAVTVGVGAPGAGKSNLAIVSALAIATGQPLTGEAVYRSGRVWIHNNEESIEELYRRIGGMLQCHGIDFASVRENIFVTSGLDERLIVAIKLKDIVRRTAAVTDVIASIKEKGIVHIAIDPFVSTHQGVSENSNEEMEQVAEAIRQIAHETGCSIDLIHHTLKSHTGNTEVYAGDMNAARGASSLIGAARIVYTVSPMSKKTAENMGIDREEAGRLIRLDHGKGNYTARDTNERWLELVPFNIRNRGDGTDDLFFIDGDTIAVPRPWERPNLAIEQTTQVEDREHQRSEEIQRVRAIVAQAMTSDRCQLTEAIPKIMKAFEVGDSTARKRLKKAIPEGEDVCVEVGGRIYSLTIERQLPSPPGHLFIIRKPITVRAVAA